MPTVKATGGRTLTFDGECIANVRALNHDDSPRREFRLYRTATGYVAERVDDPSTIDVRYWAVECVTIDQIYQFFGNEPLANYLYGVAGFNVPGLVLIK